ncbi:WavE lipopolysaccharide synthesis family protein [Photorhabdus sp. CRCIA-P01]|uniref:WavE lipopolysaccharide synthesis family protein n=1 Tax=Photorhabdus sp. CRCIA-P01 TaxID=2019570 RepID=UPI000E59F07A|nr:WavE lipopolysaccharide synthesis family protein [Photorhabdus sp. CRCIA-P01]
MSCTELVKNNVSIVMQGSLLKGGKVDQEIISNILAVRKTFPSSELIVSTWQLDDYESNKLALLAKENNISFIYNKDPGTITSSDGKVSSNINRMIVSTKAGIQHCNNLYVIKIRTDSYFDDDQIIRLLRSVSNSRFNIFRDTRYKVFKNYIVNCSLFSRDARGYLPYLFHPGDICLAGNKDDLLSLFDAPYADSSIFGSFSRNCFHSLMKYVPEQYIWTQCISKVRGAPVYNGNGCYNEQIIQLSEKYYVNNFIPFSAAELNFHWPKHKIIYNSKGRYSVYTTNDWKFLYNYYNLNYFRINRKAIYFKAAVTRLMYFYFFFRTWLLQIPFVRNFAVRMFRKRG